MAFVNTLPTQKPTPEFAKIAPIPCAHKGINAIASLMEMDPQEAIYIYNMICTQSGLQVRPGYRQWAPTLAGVGGVRTIIPVRGNNVAGTNDHLFACTSNGIYEITNQGASSLVVSWPTPGGDAGWCSWDHCTNAGGDEILMLCDEVNGYYTYDTNTTTWLQVTQAFSGTAEIAGGVVTVGLLTGTATTGTYTATSLTGGHGTGAVGTVTVTSGNVSAVTITAGGTGYLTGDLLSFTITGGSGTCTVVSVSGTALTIQTTTSGVIQVGAEIYTVSGGVLTDTGAHVVSGSGVSWVVSPAINLPVNSSIAILGSTQIYGVNPAQFCFVRLFNTFNFFVQKGTGNSWILPVGQVYGIATQFSYGNKFNHGGNLNSLWGFTYGSYFGTYIYLVGIGDAGDVIAYTGTNPFNSATWSMAGQWYVGDIPPGRRPAVNYGGDLIILSAYGALNLSALFYQKDIGDPNQYMTKKIAPPIKDEISIAQYKGWEVVPYPNQNCMLILDPNVNYPNNTFQFCYNLLTSAWSIFRGVPMQTAATWHNALFTGGSDGNVYQMYGGQDNIVLGSTSGSSINWGCLGSFNNLQMPGTLKFVDLIRPYFLTDQNVQYNVFARYDFDLSDLMLGSGLGASPLPKSAWDSAIWDTDLWGVGSTKPQIVLEGASGAGRFCAAGLLGSSNGKSTLIGFDASYRPTQSYL